MTQDTGQKAPAITEQQPGAVHDEVAGVPATVLVNAEGMQGTADGGGTAIVELIKNLVQPLGQALPASSEVVLHDLKKLPDSIIAVHGDVTGRRVGDPATDLLLQRVSSGELDHILGYHTTLPDGRSMRSTTMIVRDLHGVAIAALCINSDLSVWETLNRIATDMMGARSEEPAIDPRPDEPTEVFARDVDELAAHLIHTSIQQQGVPVELMKKEHKLAVVRDLKSRGMFLLRDAVEMIAGSLQVTRFTIYNYLNEIADQTPVEADPGPDGEGETEK